MPGQTGLPKSALFLRQTAEIAGLCVHFHIFIHSTMERGKGRRLNTYDMKINKSYLGAQFEKITKQHFFK